MIITVKASYNVRSLGIINYTKYQNYNTDHNKL